RTTAQEGQAFHLTIHVRVKQHNADLSSLILQDVQNLTILGDEKHTTPISGDGTDYLETLTVAGVAPGKATVSPAYIDARDPSRGGKPFRFSSNTLHISIVPQSSESEPPWQEATKRALRIGAGAIIGIVAIVAFGLVLRRVGRGRRRAYVTLPTARPFPPPPQPRSPGEQMDGVRRAAANLSVERSRTKAADVRSALFAFAGARTDETLASLLERIPSDRMTLRAALRAAERATFVDEPNLQGAIEDLLDAVRHVIAA
ncbi:MAG: hypothetical protein ACREMT_08545, partial [Vulcanimicrobiaceae bacterium]